MNRCTTGARQYKSLCEISIQQRHSEVGLRREWVAHNYIVESLDTYSNSLMIMVEEEYLEIQNNGENASYF